MEKRRRNSPHRYRVAKQLLRIVAAGALLLCQTFMLSAQDRYATAVYDAIRANSFTRKACLQL